MVADRPRVLTLTDALTSSTVWLESRLDGGGLAERRLTVRGWQIEIDTPDGEPVYWLNPDYYGIADRAWSDKPDEATMSAAPWREWPESGQGIDVYARRKKRDG